MGASWWRVYPQPRFPSGQSTPWSASWGVMLKALGEKPGGEWRSLPRKDDYLMGQGTNLADLERSSGTIW